MNLGDNVGTSVLETGWSGASFMIGDSQVPLPSASGVSDTPDRNLNQSPHPCSTLHLWWHKEEFSNGT